MKKKLLVTVLACTVLGIASNLAFAKKDIIGDLMLQNIELLSSGESGLVACVMYGSLDCPGTSIKVRMKW